MTENEIYQAFITIKSLAPTKTLFEKIEDVESDEYLEYTVKLSNTVDEKAQVIEIDTLDSGAIIRALITKTDLKQVRNDYLQNSKVDINQQLYLNTYVARK